MRRLLSIVRDWHPRLVARRSRATLALAAPACVLLAASSCGKEAPSPDWLAAFPAQEFARGEPLSARPLTGRGNSRSDSLTTEKLLGDSAAFNRISSLRVFGPRLLVTDASGGDHLILINRTTGAIEKRFGRHGEGPGEFRDPRWSHHHTSDSSLAWIYDYSLRRLVLADLAGDQQTWLRRTIRLNQGPYLSEPVILGERFVSNGYFVGHTLSVSDTSWKTMTHFAGERPLTAAGIDPSFAARTIRSRIATDPSHTRLALAYQSANRIDFFDAAARLRGSAAGPRQIAVALRRVESPRASSMRWGENNELAYVGIDATHEHVFALFCGACNASRMPRRIHVFTWEGEFVTELVLDRSVESIAVSPDGVTLYGSVEDPYSTIASWRLPVSFHQTR